MRATTAGWEIEQIMTVMMVEVQWLHLIGTRVNPILAARKAAARVVEWGAPALGVWQEAKLEAENLVLAAKLEVKAAGCLRIRREAKRREALAEVPVGKVPWVAPELEKALRVRALVPELVLARVREPVPEQDHALEVASPRVS